MSLREAAIAANRFGLGARPGELSGIAEDPRGWLLAQLGKPSVRGPAELAALAPSTERALLLRDGRKMKKEDEDGRKTFRRALREVFVEEMVARELVAAKTDAPFRERLVRFWSNHLAVSTSRQPVLALAGPYEREAIRPHLDGSFEQLLFAAERHPAMLLYLDNARSIGPDSPVGQRSGRGLNENHAREILELHTLGVDGGYDQDDVEQLAAVLTGWGPERGQTGAFGFEPARHQPGSKRLLGKRIAEGGADEGRQALSMLARHPSTARHLATKLVRHFVSDHPSPEVIDALTAVFVESGGHLPTVHAALVALPAAWERRLSKLKSPAELVVSTARGLGYQASGEPMLRSVRYLGQVPFAAPSPQGWPDAAKEWLGPEAVLTRVEWAEKVGADAAYRSADPAALGADLLGPLLTDRSREGIGRASSPAQGIALLVASPEFQRR